jgi:phenylalanyl-tRNA synthetase beta chain
MHAFDFDKLDGGIVVRTAASGEKLTLLDGSEVTLDDETLVIADTNRAVAMAGIMGGEGSAVSETTVNLFLEVAFFTPHLLAGKARAYGMHTDASHRFERGVDPQLQVLAMERATQLLLGIVGGEAGPINEQTADKHMPARPDVTLRAERIVKLLGFDLDGEEVERILTGLGLGVTATEGGWRCTVPSWRFDISIEADLLEELARVYGYNRLPVSVVHANLDIPADDERSLSPRYVRRHLAARGFREAITYSFVEPALQKIFDPDLEPVALANPISADMSVMRTSLLPGLTTAALRNVNRQRPRVRLFETGLRFTPGEKGLLQTPTLAMIATGSREPEGWTGDASPVDFFDLKAEVESLFALSRQEGSVEFVATERHGLHPGQTATIFKAGEPVGYLGALHPSVAAQLGLEAAVFVCEVNMDAVLSGVLPQFSELSRFPEVRRDLAFIVDREVSVAKLMSDIKKGAGSYLVELTLFDVYTGKGIDPKRKSVALGLTFRDQSRTLGDDDVNPALGQVVDLLKKNYKAELRS